MILPALLLALAVASPPSPALSDHPNVIVLGYHDVEPTDVTPANDPSRSITIEQFRQQLDALAAHGYTVIPVGELHEFLAGERTALPERSAVITVDDGWLTTRTQVAQELQARKLPFTAFIYARTADRHSHHTFNLSWDDITELAKADVDIQSHTYSHQRLSRGKHLEMTDDQYRAWLDDELRESRELISRHSGHEVHFLAYPFGDFDAGVVEAAKAAGYDGAFTVRPGLVTRASNPYALNRYVVLHETSLSQFESWLDAPDTPPATIPIVASRDPVDVKAHPPASEGNASSPQGSAAPTSHKLERTPRSPSNPRR